MLRVAILILMEDALRQRNQCHKTSYRKIRRNPYFNGRCLKTYNISFARHKASERRNPYFNGRCLKTVKEILESKSVTDCRNPYFNGRCLKT